MAAARGVRRRELFRTAAADLIGAYGTDGHPAEQDRGHAADVIGGAVSDLTAATIAGALRAAVRDQWGDTLPTRFTVIGMGRFGGHELGYGSDADVLFVHEPREGADEQEAAKAAHAVANEMRRLLQLPSSDPPLPIDADLRPEGKTGPLVRTLSSYAAYYRRWSLVWEAQALLRAEPVAGDAELGSGSSSWSIRCATRWRAWARTPYARSAGSRPGWRPTAAARRRPDHPHQARPRSGAERRGVDRAAAPDAARLGA
ncbi:Bifunctional glutamine synthetase adenylyltransferase/adenylyl-removing enzyme [Streptomyces rimosus subsp. rimosus]